jgi:cytochrome c peroxidase
LESAASTIRTWNQPESSWVPSACPGGLRCFLFDDAFPATARPLDCENDVSGTYDRIGLAIAAFEISPEVNAFTSKYDYYLRGMVDLTGQELEGLQLFEGAGQCNLCHPSEPGPNGELPLFTDYSFDNLGVPKNPDNSFYGCIR